MSAERTVNPIPGYNPSPPFLSAAVKSNGFVYTSGQIGATPEGQLLEGPIEVRVTQIMDNLDAVLKAHGTSLQHTIKFNIYITDYKNFDAINKIYTARVPSPAPARSCIGVYSLPKGTDIEIECVAVVPTEAKL